MRDLAAAALLLGGSVLALIAGVGLHRFQDVFARMHAATKPATFGLALVVAGAALRMDDLGAISKLVLVGVLQFVTAPIAAHMVGRAAHRAGTELSEDTVVDDLAARAARNGGRAAVPMSSGRGDAPIFSRLQR